MSEKPTVPCPECGAVNWYHVAWYWSCGGKDGHPCGHIYGVSESPRPDDNTLEKLRVFASGNYSYSCDAEGKKILQLLDWAEHLEACIAELEAERDELERRLKASDEQLERVANQRNVSTRQRNHLESQLADCELKCDGLERQLDEYKKLYLKMKDLGKDNHHTIYQYRETNDALEGEVKRLKAERDNLRESCINLKKSIDGYLDDIMELKAGRDELERRLAECKELLEKGASD